jgi:Putative peptidoglycan binding domain
MFDAGWSVIHTVFMETACRTYAASIGPWTKRGGMYELVADPKTKAAIRNFEKNYNMPVTGEPSEALVTKMKNLGLL